MSGLETIEDTAALMAGRWRGKRSADVVLGDGVLAAMLTAPAGEIWAAPSEANILSLVTGGRTEYRHWHDGREVHVGRAGSGTLAIEPAGVRPRGVSDSQLEIVHLYLSHGALVQRVERERQRQATALTLFDIRGQEDPTLRALMSCVAEACGSSSSDRLYRDSLVDAIVQHVLARWSNLADLPLVVVRGGLAPWQVKRWCEAIVVRLDGDIGLEELAAIVGLLATHFSRAFKQSTGLAPFHWLAERRIEKAKALLADTPTPLAEIALDCGFAAQPQFTTAFRRATGMTPGRWRRERAG